MKLPSIIAILILTAGLAQAAPDRPVAIKTTVNGMVCSFCAQGILAHFKKHPAVSKVHVDLTRKAVLLEERKGHSITDKEIIDHIKKAGFEPVKVERLKTSFEETKTGS
jgi:copper chaperone CopZ